MSYHHSYLAADRNTDAFLTCVVAETKSRMRETKGRRVISVSSPFWKGHHEGHEPDLQLGSRVVNTCAHLSFFIVHSYSHDSSAHVWVSVLVTVKVYNPLQTYPEICSHSDLNPNKLTAKMNHHKPPR